MKLFPRTYEELYESFPTHRKARQLSVEQVVELRERGAHVVFVDARGSSEQQVSVIGDPIRVPLDTHPLRTREKQCARALAEPGVAVALGRIAAGDVVVAYCTAGLRGAYCAMALEKQLGRPCFNLLGGIVAWKNAKQPLNRDGEPTTDVDPCLPGIARFIEK